MKHYEIQAPAVWGAKIYTVTCPAGGKNRNIWSIKWQNPALLLDAMYFCDVKINKIKIRISLY